MSDEPNVELKCLTARSSDTIMSVGSLRQLRNSSFSVMLFERARKTARVVCFVLLFALYVHKPMAPSRKLDNLADIVRLGVWMPLQHLLELFVVNVGRLLLDHRRLGSGTTHLHGTTKRLHSSNTHMHMPTQTHTHTRTCTQASYMSRTHKYTQNMYKHKCNYELKHGTIFYVSNWIGFPKIARLAATASQKNTRRANLTCPVASGFCTQHRWCHTAATSP